MAIDKARLKANLRDAKVTPPSPSEEPEMTIDKARLKANLRDAKVTVSKDSAFRDIVAVRDVKTAISVIKGMHKAEAFGFGKTKIEDQEKLTKSMDVKSHKRNLDSLVKWMKQSLHLNLFSRPVEAGGCIVVEFGLDFSAVSLWLEKFVVKATDEKGAWAEAYIGTAKSENKMVGKVRIGCNYLDGKLVHWSMSKESENVIHKAVHQSQSKHRG